MAAKEPSKKKKKEKVVTEPIGYPDKPLAIRYIVIAAAAWGAWLAFLIAMAYIRWHEWPFWPT